MSRFLSLVAGLMFVAASFMVTVTKAEASAVAPSISIEGVGNLIEIHGSHCGYRWGRKKNRRPYNHRHGNRCARKKIFGLTTPGHTYYRGYGDPDAYRHRRRYRRRPVRRRCWRNSWNELVCTRRSRGY